MSGITIYKFTSMCFFYLKDVFEKAVSTINDVYMDQKELLLDMQTKLEKKQTEINTVKAQLEGKEKETIALKVKLDEKDEENSTKDTKLNALRKQLQEMEDSCKKCYAYIYTNEH